jgi:hypothetical protein
MGLEVALQCDPRPVDLPTVFCSRHGDMRRTFELLETLARDEPLSPTSFGLSVHNAVGGMLSIALASHAAMTAIAGGVATVPAGILEACSLLSRGAPEVLLVAHDEPPPDAYQQFRDEEEVVYAWAWRMTQPTDVSYALTLELAGTPAMGATPVEPLGLEILRCFLLGVQERRLQRRGQTWRWRRYA